MYQQLNQFANLLDVNDKHLYPRLVELNEKRLDSINTSIKGLERSLENFNSIKKESRN